MNNIPGLVLEAFPKLQSKDFVRSLASPVPLVSDTTFDIFVTDSHDFFALVVTDYVDPNGQSLELKNISGTNSFEFTSLQKPFDTTGETIDIDKINEINTDWFVTHSGGSYNLYYYVANLKANSLADSIMKNSRLNRLRTEIFTEPVSVESRDALISYIKENVSRAKSLSKAQLLGDEGHVLAMDIAGALAFQSSKDVQGSWTDKDEPELSNVLDIAGKLDEDANNEEVWKKLFTAVGKI